jgi:hypothetical protein
MTLTAEPKFTVKEAADGSPTVFLEDMDDIGLLISFKLRPDPTIENARAVARFLNKEVRQITIQSDYDLAV